MKDKILNSEIRILNHAFSAKKVLLHPLFSGSLIMIVGSNTANFIAYIYHLIFGRILGPASYGELVTTISLIGLIMSAVSFFGMVIVKFVSSGDSKDIPSILGWFDRKLMKTAIVFTLMIWILAPFIGSYVKLPKNIIILFAPILFFSIYTLVYRSFLHGIMKFKEVAILSNFELFGRLLFGLIFVYLNMGVFGATLGFLISVICGLFLAKYFLKDVGMKYAFIEGFNWSKVIKYAFPVFVVSFSYTSLLTTDLVMVKHFFSSHDAGIYGSISNLGKIIFYGSAPVASVMFPIISKRKSQGMNFLGIFFISILLVLSLGLGVFIIYLTFPEIIIKILYGKDYLEGSKYLYLMGIYYIFYSLANLVSSFLLSIDQVKPLLWLPVFAFIQIIIIYFYHDSLAWIIGASIASVSLLLLYLGLYFAYAKNKIS